MRRDAMGGKRGDGNHRSRRRVRPDARKISVKASDSLLTGVSGLVQFAAFARRIGLDAALRASFTRLKPSGRVIRGGSDPELIAFAA